MPYSVSKVDDKTCGSQAERAPLALQGNRTTLTTIQVAPGVTSANPMAGF